MSAVVHGENNVQPFFELSTFPKYMLWPKFKDPAVEVDYRMYKDKMARQVTPTSAFLYFLFLVVYTFRIVFFYSFDDNSAWGDSNVIIVAYAASAVAVISCFFSLLVLLLKTHSWAKKCLYYSPGLSSVAFNTANVLYLLGRVIRGTCVDGENTAFCNPIAGALPIYHALSIPVGTLVAVIICRGITDFSFIFLTNLVNSVGLTACVIIACSRNVIVGVICQSLFVYFCVLSSAFQDMTTFEYYLMAQRRFADEISERDHLAGLEQSQLKMVLANVAHDLKTPLISFDAGIHMILTLIQDYRHLVSETVNPSVAALIASIHEASVDMEASGVFMMMQINRALDVSKIDCNVKLLAHYETVSVGDVVQWAVSVMRRVQDRVTFRVSPCVALLQSKVITDKGWLQENLLCLLSNAVKYSPQSTTVIITLSLVDRPVEGAHFPSAGSDLSLTSQTDSETPERRMLLVDVEDSGIGVPAHQLERLFRPFAQTQRRAGGTGLGLYSLALRIQELKGFYGVRTPTDHAGSVFYFAIPYNVDDSYVIEESVSDSHPTGTGLPEIRTSMSTGNSLVSRRDRSPAISAETFFVADVRAADTTTDGDGRKVLLGGPSPVVLVVDDSAPTLKLVARALRHDGVVVETASDGFAALNLMKKFLYTAVIMDVQMPVMDGVEAVRQLREWERGPLSDNKHQYVLSASASPDEATRLDSIAAGTDFFVVKPLVFSQLLSCINAQHNPA